MYTRVCICECMYNVFFNNTVRTTMCKPVPGTPKFICIISRNAFLLLFLEKTWRRQKTTRRNGIRFLPSTTPCIPDNSIDQTHQVCVCVAIDQIHQQQSQFTASTLSSFQAFRSRRSNSGTTTTFPPSQISPNEGTESVP